MMKSNTLKAITVPAILSLIIVISGCSKKSPDQYGAAIQNRETVGIGKVLTTPKDYEEKTISIQGKITAVCPAGCWFDVAQGNAEIHVDIHPSGFAIPQKSGSDVFVEGVLSIKDSKPVLIGTGVEIQ